MRHVPGSYRPHLRASVLVAVQQRSLRSRWGAALCRVRRTLRGCHAAVAMALLALVALLPRDAAAQEQLILDAAWQPNVTNGTVYATAPDAEGRLLIGGYFSDINGTPRPGLARLNPNGTLDTSFAGSLVIQDNGGDPVITSIVPLPDGSIVIGGHFDKVGSPTLKVREGVARLTSTGALDESFTPPSMVAGTANTRVSSLLRLTRGAAAGKIIAVGRFVNAGGTGRGKIIRLNANGTLDTSFASVTFAGAPSDLVSTVAEQSDGKLIIGGYFFQVGGASHQYLARLWDTGAVDTGFNAGANTTVNRVLVQPDGQIVMAGYFTTVAGNDGVSVSARRIARLRANLTVDSSFTATAGADNGILAMQRLADGRLLIGGDFNNVYSTATTVARSKLALLQANGAPDAGFVPGAVLSGGIQALAVQADGRVIAGGDFATASRNRLERLVQIGPMTGARAISAGGYHSCALQGYVMTCWGYNSYGQLGDGSQLSSSIPVVSNFDPETYGPERVTAISAGFAHTCALALGYAWCWGNSANGRTGAGSFSLPLVVPSIVQPSSVGGPPLSGPTAISAGGMHTCAITSDGTAWCWGSNAYGQLGIANPSDSGRPVAVNFPMGGFSAIGTGDSHTCALTQSNGVYCWGRGDSGQLGSGGNSNFSSPNLVTGLSSGVLAIAVGGVHTCVLTTTSKVKCWGANSYGELGVGDAIAKLTPVEVPNLSNVTAITAGMSHTCALIANGEAKCWGFNDYGQIGDGTQTQNAGRLTPVSVRSAASPNGAVLTGITAISAGESHTCAIHNGVTKCWGYNAEGQVGDNSAGNYRLVPTPVLAPLPPPVIFQNGFE